MNKRAPSRQLFFPAIVLVPVVIGFLGGVFFGISYPDGSAHEFVWAAQMGGAGVVIGIAIGVAGSLFFIPVVISARWFRRTFNASYLLPWR